MESIEAATIGNKLGTLFLEDLPDRPVRPFRYYGAAGGREVRIGLPNNRPRRPKMMYLS